MSTLAVPDEVQRVFDEWDEVGRPAQPAIAWQRDQWIERYPGLTAQFEALPDNLDRTAVRAIVLDKPLTNQGMFDAMVATYAWGWSVTHVGLGRAAPVLNAGAAAVGHSLLAARARLLGEGAVAGYWALATEHRIVGLGPSVATKFLYFCSDADARALILDRLVACWITERTPLEITASRFVKRGYETYTGSMSAWGNELGIAAHVVEELVFGDEARRRHLPGWGD
jgi:hypothetical protein